MGVMAHFRHPDEYYPGVARSYTGGGQSTIDHCNRPSLAARGDWRLHMHGGEGIRKLGYSMQGPMNGPFSAMGAPKYLYYKPGSQLMPEHFGKRNYQTKNWSANRATSFVSSSASGTAP